MQSGAKNTAGPAGKGNPWLKGALGEAANAAARTDTFLGARYRRIVKRRGHAKALVAVARSILVITWHLINDPDARYQELGTDWHQRHLNPARKTRDLVRQLQALGTTSPSHPLSWPDLSHPHPQRNRPAPPYGAPACPEKRGFSVQHRR
ncbi:hypothetical protein [Streptomyces agglomeratus]|uniref:hypothetical protein n=1 Tax=Streptomyces agglomeratus TaxID=285458 RepID=UPI0030B8D6E7